MEKKHFVVAQDTEISMERSPTERFAGDGSRTPRGPTTASQEQRTNMPDQGEYAHDHRNVMFENQVIMVDC